MVDVPPMRRRSSRAILTCPNRPLSNGAAAAVMEVLLSLENTSTALKIDGAYVHIDGRYVK